MLEDIFGKTGGKLLGVRVDDASTYPDWALGASATGTFCYWTEGHE